MAQQVAFIAGLGHIGSTVLDLCLGASPRIVGLGEVSSAVRDVAHVLSESTWSPCSCGQTMAECPFWSGVLEQYRRHPDSTIRQRYGFVLEAFREMFGPDTVLVDSSKGREWLGIVAELEDVDLRVIRLMRDVRSWTVSVRRHAERRGETRLLGMVRKSGPRGVMTWLLSTRLGLVWRWYLGYEELALYPETVLPRVCEFLGIDFDERMLVPGNTNSHVARGNPMRSRDDKLKRIQYDDRWFRDGHLQLPMALSPHIMSYNRRHVYPNVGETLWDQQQLYGRGIRKPAS
jgi:hypothetical protein